MQRVTGLVIASALVALACTGGCPDVTDPFQHRAQEDFTLTAATTTAGGLSIEWSNGTIDVTFDATATGITAAGEKFAYAGTQAAADSAVKLVNITLSVQESFPESARLRLATPSGALVSYGANVGVTVPAGLTLVITSDNGHVTVTGNTGQTTIELANGNVTITAQAGDTRATVGNGNIDLASTSGNVAAVSSNGNVAVDSLGGNVSAETANGNVTVAARPAAGGSVLAQADIGTVTLRVPATFAADLALRTDIGSLATDLTGFTVTNLTQSLVRLTAQLNGGGGTLTGTTSIGTVDFAALP